MIGVNSGWFIDAGKKAQSDAFKNIQEISMALYAMKLGGLLENS